MSLSSLTEYKIIALPAHIDDTLPKSTTTLQKDIAERIASFSGEPTVLQPGHLPFWYYLLFFKQLRNASPEIVTEVESGFYLVLHSVQISDDVVRPESVHIVPELLAEPKKEPAERTEEVLFDLGAIPQLQAANILETVFSIKKQAQFTRQVIFQGQTDPATALVCFVIWLHYAQNILYKTGDRLLSL